MAQTDGSGRDERVIERPIDAMIEAGKRAGFMRGHDMGSGWRESMPIFRGAVTHSAAYLLDALEEIGWTLTRKS